MSYNPQHTYVQPPKSGLAITSLILGIAGLFTCGLTAIPAIIFGVVALNQIKRDGVGGRGQAVAGTVLGGIFTLGWIIFWVWWIGIIGLSVAAPSPTESPDRVTISLPAQEGTKEEQEEAAPQQQEKDDDDKVTVQFEAVTPDGAAKALNITTSVNFTIEQDNGVALPFTKEVKADPLTPVSMSVQLDGSGTVECRIKIDGKTVKEATSKGSYSICTVSAITETS